MSDKGKLDDQEPGSPRDNTKIEKNQIIFLADSASRHKLQRTYPKNMPEMKNGAPGIFSLLRVDRDWPVMKVHVKMKKQSTAEKCVKGIANNAVGTLIVNLIVG